METDLKMRQCDMCGRKTTSEKTFGGLRFYGWFRLTIMTSNITLDLCSSTCLSAATSREVEREAN